jgi:tellurite resistance protein TerC
LSDASTTAWIIFIVSIAALLLLDLGVFNRKAHVIKPREAMLQVAFFISAAVIFNLGIYLFMGSTSGLEFTTGYLMEIMLSVDNLFVMILIFGAFCVPRKDQHKVLFYGILGALVFRLAFILVGVTLVNSFDWVLYLFGAFLIFTGIKMAVGKEKEEVEPEHNVVVKFFRKFLPVTKGYEGDKFFVKKQNDAGKMIRWATPMFITLIVIETTDILFAVDSIPAVLGITTSAFIVFSSNAFAILGLRSLYFSLAHIMNAFCYLKYALAGILSFVGVKMIVVYWGIHIDVLVSLAVIVIILVVAIAASMLRNRRRIKEGVAEGTAGCPVQEGLGGPDSNTGEACPALKELRDTEEKYHK